MSTGEAKTGEVVEPLSAEEHFILQNCEVTIADGLAAFVEIGRALAEIRDGHLYRLKFSSFEHYCADRWDISRRHGDRLIEAAEIVRPIGSRPDLALPFNERQARALGKVTEADRAEVWHRVLRAGKPSAAAVRKAAERLKDERYKAELERLRQAAGESLQAEEARKNRVAVGLEDDRPALDPSVPPPDPFAGYEDQITVSATEVEDTAASAPETAPAQASESESESSAEMDPEPEVSAEREQASPEPVPDPGLNQPSAEVPEGTALKPTSCARCGRLEQQVYRQAARLDSGSATFKAMAGKLEQARREIGKLAAELEAAQAALSEVRSKPEAMRVGAVPRAASTPDAGTQRTPPPNIAL